MGAASMPPSGTPVGTLATGEKAEYDMMLVDRIIELVTLPRMVS